MKKAFTLIEIVIVLLIISILLVATIGLGSNRITDIKAQSIKEQFIGYYNELYSQNMTSRFRDYIQYQRLHVIVSTWIAYRLDASAVVYPPLSAMELGGIRFAPTWTVVDQALLTFLPYRMGCEISRGDGSLQDTVYFHLLVPENGKQYCFEIASETCKLIERHCREE